MKYYFLQIGQRLLLWRFDDGVVEKLANDGRTWIRAPSAASHISGMGDGDADEITKEQARNVYRRLFPEGDPDEAIP